MAEQKELKYVRFDVGHHLHVCHRDTLLKNPESVLAKFVSPEFDKRESEEDYIAIERDGKHFGAILSYLRDGAIDLSSYKLEDLEQLLKEAEYYCLPKLEKICEEELEERKLESWQKVNLAPSPAILAELEQAEQIIKARGRMAIVADLRVADYFGYKEVYSMFHPITVYFVKMGLPKTNGGYHSMILYNHEGEQISSTGTCETNSPADEIFSRQRTLEFWFEVKKEHINPLLSSF